MRKATEENLKIFCRLEFENIIKKLKKNVDRNLTEFIDKWRLGTAEEFEAIFVDAIELKIGCGITITKKEIELNNTKRGIKNLFKAKLMQMILSYQDYLEYEAKKFEDYYNKIKDI